MISKKLVAALSAMLTIAALIIGLALINAQILIDNKELLALCIVSITGLGGYAVNRQAALDAMRPE